MKVAIVHDWLIHMRGGEKVLEAIAEIYPEAPIYTLFCRRAKLSPILQGRRIFTSFLQYLPGIHRYYRWLLPLLPAVIRTLKIPPADLVISTSHCVAKGIGIPAGAFHICYCHTPMRYIWGFEDLYFGKFPVWIKPFLDFVFQRLRRWDLKTNDTVHAWIANSENVKDRIRRFYGRDACVIYPPVDVAFYHYRPAPAVEYYLTLSAFVPYKRLDLVIEAFNRFDRKLLVAGDGPMAKRYRTMAQDPSIVFLGSISDQELRKYYSSARAVIFPAEEDFGIIPVEAQACGTPVIAFGKGGSLETVKSGVFFGEQTPAAVREAVLKFEALNFDRERVRQEAEAFGRQNFKDRFKKFVEDTLAERKAS